MTWSIVEDPMT